MRHPFWLDPVLACRRLRIGRVLLLVLIGIALHLPASVLAADLISVRITTQSVEGTTIPDIALELHGTGVSPQSITTDSKGAHRWEAPSDLDFEDLRFRSTSANFQVLDHVSVKNAGTTYIAVRLFPGGLQGVGDADLQWLAESFPRLLGYHRDAASTDTLKGNSLWSAPGAIRLLDGYRSESQVSAKSILEAMRAEAASGDARKSPPVKPLAAKAGDAVLASRVVDHRGLPLKGMRVLLMMLDEEAGTLEVVSSAVSAGEQGEVSFTGIQAGKLHRLEVSPGPNDRRVARSTMVRLRAGEKKKLASLILRETDETVGGLVFNGAKPVPGVTVGVAGLPQVKALTDASGYFSLGPVPAGEVVLLIKSPSASSEARLRVQDRSREVLVPLHILQPRR